MEVYLKDRLVNVIIIPKKIKNIYFRFDENLNLVISTNKRVKEKEIKSLIKKNEDSLYRLLMKSARKVIHDKEFWYLGNKYEIVYQDRKDLEFIDGVIYTKDDKMLEKFLKTQVDDIFTEEVANLRKVIKTPDFTLKFRKMKTRWGVCNYKLKTITLNTELIKYRKELLRYVIVHEMCHFYHHNHGREFWQMVEEYYPNYKEARKELRG